ncbi:MAG: hypothetical protein ABR591_06585 [Candidatus Velthaea sp.]
MWYAPYLRARRATIVYVLFLLALTAIAIAVRFAPGVHLNESASDRHDIANFYADLSLLAGGASAFVAGLATVLGLSLAAENAGHLELTWTKPIVRERYALSVFAVDFAAMAAAQVLTIACAVLTGWIWMGHQVFTFDPHAAWRDIGAILFPVYIYAWIVALTASLKRSRGAVAGFFWPAMLVLAGMSHIHIGVVRALGDAINTVNPVVLFSESETVVTSPAQYGVAIIGTMILLAFALVEWRRVEA